MSLDKNKLNNQVNQFFSEQFRQSQTNNVPHINDTRLTHGATGIEGEFTFLYVDIRGSSDLSSSHRRQTIARIYKAFHYCMVEAIKSKNGSVRSFDGDRVMGIFTGDRKVNNAIEAAKRMKGLKVDILSPKIKAKYKNENFDIGIGIATGLSMSIKAGQGYDINNRDLVWIGDAPNLGAKLSDISIKPNNIHICSTSFSSLIDKHRWYIDSYGTKKDMWKQKEIIFRGKTFKVYSSSWYYHI